MKKFAFTINGNKYDVAIKEIEDGLAQVEVNGSSYKVEIHHEQAKVKTPKLVRRSANPLPDSEKAKTAPPTEKKGAGHIKAPLPGTILDIKVKQGDQVKPGDILLIMEAMKMENNIKADRAGTITEIKVKTNDSVLEGDILVEIGG